MLSGRSVSGRMDRKGSSVDRRTSSIGGISSGTSSQVASAGVHHNAQQDDNLKRRDFYKGKRKGKGDLNVL